MSPDKGPPAPTVFCHFHSGIDSSDSCSYDKPVAFADLRATLDGALAEYNSSHSNNVAMELVLFADAVCHVARIARVLNQPAGHAMLVGQGGLGKRSLVRLAAFTCQCTVRAHASSANSIADFKNELRDAMKECGIKREKLCLLVTEAQLLNDHFYACLDELISSASVTGLFFKDEIDSICSLIASRAKGAGYGANVDSVWLYFTALVRENLHVVLCFSQEKSAFASTFWSRYPSLTSCVTV